MAKKRNWPEWPALWMRWTREQLLSRWHKKSTTVEKNIDRILDWLGLMIYVAAREYERREALTQQVAELSRQMGVVQQELEAVKELAQLEIVQNVILLAEQE